MIVETMTWKEMFDTISADYKKIEFRMEKRLRLKNKVAPKAFSILNNNNFHFF